MKTQFSFSTCSRRDSFQIGLGALALAFFGPKFGAFAQAPAADPAPSGPFQLPPLPYSYEALEPAIDATTMRIHHDKHHKAYVDNANRLLADLPQFEGMSPDKVILNLDKAPEAVRKGLIDNVGGHINHTLFWQMMAPGAGGPPTGAVKEAIEKTFGSFEAFQKELQTAGMKRFGSGWAWLVKDKDGKLSIISTPNQDPPIMNGLKPLLGVDVWEHAYYLNYQNRRADYLTAWWNTVNWDFVNNQLASE
ncbi:MAG: superoxide dismutase [Terrimicrobiaceae bacterium]